VNNSPGDKTGSRTENFSAVPPWWRVLAILGFAPLLTAFFLNLWQQPEYQFFPMAVVAAVFFARTRSREIPRPLIPGSLAGFLTLLVLSLVGLAAATLIWSPWLGAVSAFPAGIAVVWRLGGKPMLRALCPTFILLAVILPPPLGLDAQFALFLRSLATTLSSHALHFLGVLHTVEGHVIALPKQRLLVEEACSGIHSLVFVSAFSLFYLLWKRREWWCYLVLIPTVLAAVVAGNAFRISIGAWLRYHDSIDILTGWKHEALSIGLVVGYIAVVLGVEHFLPRGKKPAREEPEKPVAFQQMPGQKFSPGWTWVAGIAFAALGLVGGVRAWEKSAEGIEPLRMASATLRQDAVFHLPATLEGWTRQQAGPPLLNKIESLGLSTLIWTYEYHGLTAVVALDYPISGYHDVGGCYENAGWQLGRKEHVNPGAGKPDRIEIDMVKPSGNHGMLWFATMNEQGQRVDEATFQRNFWGRFVNLGAPRETTYRIQLLIVSATPVNEAGRAAAEELFAAASNTLFPQILGQLNK